jgi:excinuclease UvrABC nuclease subunit
MSDKVTWSSYEFQVFSPDNTTWNEVGGIYIFTGVNAQNRWVALYIGQAKAFSERLPNHERWSEARRLGATHIHAMVVAKQADRDSIEAHLIQVCQPRLNTQLK